jgi:hypothetical protein
MVDLAFLSIFKPSVHSCPSVHQTKDILLLVSRKIALQGKFGPEVTVVADWNGTTAKFFCCKNIWEPIPWFNGLYMGSSPENMARNIRNMVRLRTSMTVGS